MALNQKSIRDDAFLYGINQLFPSIDYAVMNSVTAAPKRQIK